MILYHGTTAKRAECIFNDRAIKKECRRFFTKEENGNGYSTDGYVYLSNEMFFALSFANCHSCVDKSELLYIFRIDVPDELILADIDEIRHQDHTGSARKQYNSDLECSLLEFKACRIQNDISFEKFNVDYFVLDTTRFDNINDLFYNVGSDHYSVIKNYTIKQKEFIESIQWKSV